MIAHRKNETERLKLQADLDACKTAEERNRLGQFATPTALAADILEYAKSLVPARQHIRFLDPAIGTGAFFSALVQVFPKGRIESALGFEIDRHYADQAVKLWSQSILRLKVADFTKAVPPETESEKPNLIICNPPYVRHHHLEAEEKLRLVELAHGITGQSLSGLAGLYCYFLLLSHAWLARGGVAGWLIPSEFMGVNYGRQVKEYLLNRVTLLRIHRFDPKDVQFDDALVSSAVVWFRNDPPPPDHQVDFSYGGTLAVPALSRQVPVALLDSSSKWTRFPVSEERKIAVHKTVLSDLFTIKRGVATGANEFFILTSEQAAEHKIPKEFLRPILPSPRYLEQDEIEADAEGNPLTERPLFLLSCNLPEKVVRDSHPGLWRYLESGVREGISKRYLSTHRSPWYAQEDRPPASLLCTYMGRGGAKRENPFRFILNHSQAIAANVYLMLYPKPVLREALSRNPDLLRCIWQSLQKVPPELLVRGGRVYGGGLHKMEPKELASICADDLFAACGSLQVAGVSQNLSLFE